MAADAVDGAYSFITSLSIRRRGDDMTPRRQGAKAGRPVSGQEEVALRPTVTVRLNRRAWALLVRVVPPVARSRQTPTGPTLQCCCSSLLCVSLSLALIFLNKANPRTLRLMRSTQVAVLAAYRYGSSSFVKCRTFCGVLTSLVYNDRVSFSSLEPARSPPPLDLRHLSDPDPHI